MRSKTLVLMSALLICFLISNNPLVAQSKDRNNPTPLRSPKISGIASPAGTVYWYKLTAGPGELVIDMQVVGTSSAGGFTSGSARFVLYDRDMQEVMNESIWAGYNVERKNKSLRLKSKQDFLLAIGLGEGKDVREKSGGTYMIRFNGAIDLPPEKEER